MLLKAVDDPSIISERRVDIIVVATIVATGIDVRGLTCETHMDMVRSEHIHIELTVAFTATSSSYLYESSIAWQATIACK